MTMGHNSSIPDSPQTNEKFFPTWVKNAPPGQSGHPFPKMLVRAFTKDDRAEWLEKNRKIERNTREEYYEERCPKLGDPVPMVATQEIVDAGFAPNVGADIIVNNSEDEELVCEMLGIEVNRPLPGTLAIPLNMGPSANETRLAAENEKLRKQLAAAEDDDEDEAPVRRRRRKKKVKAKRAPRAVTIEQLGEDE
jgi:hypothetical protein